MKHKKIVFRLQLQIAVNGKTALEANFLANPVRFANVFALG